MTKQKRKQDAKELKKVQEKRSQIRAAQERIKERTELIAAQKWAQVRQYKDDIIKAEILKIGEKDSEARKLERYEQKILKRLRETHLKQQEAIEEIQMIFNSKRPPQNSSKLF